MTKHTKILNIIAGCISLMLIGMSLTVSNGAYAAVRSSGAGAAAVSGQSSGAGAEGGEISGGSCDAQKEELSNLQRQVAELQAQKDATDQAAAIIGAEANRFKNLLASSTRATSTAATSTTATTTATTTPSNTVGSSAFSLSVNPNVIRPGETFTLSVNVNSASTQKYSVHVYQNSNLIGTLLSGALVESNSRPAYVQKVFQISSSIPLGSYIVKIVDDNNTSISQTASLVVVAPNVTTNTTVVTNTVNTTNASGLNSVTFSNPFTFGIVPRNKVTPVNWTYQGSPTGTMNVYLQTRCVKNVPICTQYSPNNPTSSCVTIKSSCVVGTGGTAPVALNVPVSSRTLNWTVPRQFVDTVGTLYAEQNGQRIGGGGLFYISY